MDEVNAKIGVDPQFYFGADYKYGEYGLFPIVMSQDCQSIIVRDDKLYWRVIDEAGEGKYVGGRYIYPMPFGEATLDGNGTLCYRLIKRVRLNRENDDDDDDEIVEEWLAKNGFSCADDLDRHETAAMLKKIKKSHDPDQCPHSFNENTVQMIHFTDKLTLVRNDELYAIVDRNGRVMSYLHDPSYKLQDGDCYTHYHCKGDVMLVRNYGDVSSCVVIIPLRES